MTKNLNYLKDDLSFVEVFILSLLLISNFLLGLFPTIFIDFLLTNISTLYTFTYEMSPEEANQIHIQKFKDKDIIDFLPRSVKDVYPFKSTR